MGFQVTSNIHIFLQNPKERSLNQLKASLESMQTSKEGLESELNQELLATLSSRFEL
jgi:hypothetical protein